MVDEASEASIIRLRCFTAVSHVAGDAAGHRRGPFMEPP